MVVQPTYHWQFNEREGSVTRDLIKGVEAKLVGCSLQLHGRIGNAIQVNGKNGALYLGKEAGQLGTNDFTIAFGIVVLSRHDDNNLDIIGTRSSKSHGNWVSLLLINKNQLYFEVDEDSNGTNYFSLQSENVLNDHSWHHIALVREGLTLRIYVDGELKAQGKATGIANIKNDSDMKVGDWLRDTPTARYEDLRIYHNIALSSAEIQSLVPPTNRFLRPGQIELVAFDNAAVILSQDETDLTRYSTEFQSLRLGPDTGATLYRGSNFESTSQKLYADVPEIRHTKLDAFPKSIQIWSSIGTPFTGKWIISAGNGVYLNQNKQMLQTSPQHLSGGFFSFLYNPNTYQTLLVPANGVEMPLLKVGDHKATILIVDESEFQQAAFSIVHPSGNQWLKLDGTLSWTGQRGERTLFYRVMRIADSEEQVGEITEGEVALYQHGSYHGKTWVLSDYEPGVTGNFMSLKDLQGLDNAISSIRLGPDTGVTLFANEQQRVDAGKEEIQQEDIFDNVPDMGETQIKHDNASSLKIFRTVGAETIFTSVTSKLSQDYRLVDDELEEFSAYRTILRLAPEITEVEVSATDLTTIEVDGTLYEIAENRGVVLTPNLMRQIMITSEADGFSTPGLKFRTSTMIANQFVVIFPDEEAHQQIAELEDDALWNARDAEGNLIVDQNQHSRSEIASVQNTIKRTMATVVNTPDTPTSSDAAATPIAVGNLKSVSRSIRVGATQQLVSAVEIDNPWTLNFQPRPITGTIPAGSAGLVLASPNIWEEPVEQNSFEQLFAQAESAVEPGTLIGAGAIDGTFAVRSSIGGFFGSIGDAIKDATKVTLGVLDGAFNALVEIGGKIVRFVLNTAKKVADFVEAVINKVVKSIKQFIEFLQFIFDWDDILHTKQYLVDSLNTTFDYVQNLVEAAKKPVSEFFDGIQETVEDGLDNLITKLGGNPEDKGPEFEIPEALEWLLNKFFGGNPDPLEFVPEDVKPDFVSGLSEEDFFSTFVNRIDETKTGAKIDLFEGFVEAIMSLVSNPLNPGLVVVQLVEAIKELAFEILETLNDLALDFLDFIVNAIQKLQDMLNGKFEIPFLSKLFDFIGADKLSPLNLTCLLIAIPATAISKIMTGKKPFEGVAPLDFSRPPQTSPLELEANISLALVDQPSAALTGEEDQLVTLVIAWSQIGLGADMVGGVTGAILDFIPENADDLTGPVTSFLEIVNLGAAVISWLGSFPFAPSIETGSEEENLPEMPGGFPYDIASYMVEENDDKQVLRERLMWGWRTVVLTVDLVFFVAQDKILAAIDKNQGTPRSGYQRLRRSIPEMMMLSMALSVVDLGFTIAFVKSIPSDDEEREDTVKTEIWGIMPGLCPWLRLVPLPFGFATSGALSLLDIIAMGFSLTSSKKSIEELRELKAGV